MLMSCSTFDSVDLPSHVASQSFERMITLIVQQLTGDEFENLALSCRRIQVLSTPFLARHNAYRRSWAQIDCLEYKSVLRKVARSPCIARYIKHLSIPQRFRGEDGDDSMFPAGQTCLGCSGGIVEDLDARNLYKFIANHFSHLSFGVDDPSLARRWHHHVLHDNVSAAVDYAAIFLLSLLPNLETLSLPADWEIVNAVGPSDASDLLRLTILRANDTSVPGPRPMRKLAHLYPDEPDTGDVSQSGQPITPILPFLSLTRLQSARHWHSTLQGIKLDEGYGDVDAESEAWRRYQPIGCGLKYFVLNGAGISGDQSIEALFRSMGKLKTLKLSWQSRDELVEVYAPHKLVTTVMEAAGHSMETLCLTIGWDCGVEEVREPIRNMMGFTKLRQLELDTQLFYEWTCGEDREKENEEARSSNDGDDGSSASNASMTLHQEMDADHDAKDGNDDQDPDKDREDDEEEEERHENYDGRGHSRHCPSLANLLCKSLQTLEIVTIHMAGSKADLACFRHLLHDFPGSGVQLKVRFYHRNHWGDQLDGADLIIEQAKEYLQETVPGSESKVVPLLDYPEGDGFTY